ncbi:MAG: hypothetical protein JXQ29_05845 [Planctomycetes bacterium]|nr:hypothetical protein [Planctomycetota bacterium]
MNDWNLRASSPGCFFCRAPFAPDTPFHSAIYFVPPDIERRDFCPSCWEAMPAGEALAYWRLQAADEERDPAAVGPLDLTRLKRMIRVDLQQPTAPVGLAGLLVLMMARRRLARIVSVDGWRVVARFKDEEEQFAVPAPHLDGDTLARAQEALWSLLDQAAAKA